jgi:hypothetical protein
MQKHNGPSFSTRPCVDSQPEDFEPPARQLQVVRHSRLTGRGQARGFEWSRHMAPAYML